MKLILLILASLVISKVSLANDGRRIYESTCIRCHNHNPHRAGSLGPDLYTTPLSVFKTKVPRGHYPAGYSPKRKTRMMPKFPSLENKVDSIYNYIRSFK